MAAQRFLEILFLVFSPVCAALGLMAIVSPRLFAALAERSSRWVDSRWFFDLFDKRFDVDRFVLRHSRTFGTLVLAAVSVLTYMYLYRAR